MRTLLLSCAAALALPGLVCAQPAGGPGPRRGGEACASDMQKFCADLDPEEVPACMDKHKSELSSSCKAEHEKRSAMRKRGAGPDASSEAEASDSASSSSEQPSAAKRGKRGKPGGQDLKKACAAELKKFCAGLERGEAVDCLKENKVELSSACASALPPERKQLRRSRMEQGEASESTSQEPPPGPRGEGGSRPVEITDYDDYSSSEGSAGPYPKN